VSLSGLDGTRARIRAARSLCVLVAAGSWLVLAPVASAARTTTSAGAPSASVSHSRHHRSRGARSRRALPARPDRARLAIVGGAPISVQQAPWQVTVEAVFSISKGSSESILCGGSIVDASHILTAAHCVFIAPPDERIPPSDFVVRAGTSNLKSSEAEEQEVSVASVRVHPYYTYAPDSGHVNPDDVAVLTLAEPLVFGPSVSPIALTSLGTYPAEGASVDLTGFGEQNPTTDELNGKLYSLGMTLGFSRECGGESGADNAVLLCASTPSGSPCSGDSGSALAAPGSSPALVGVMNDYTVVAGKECAAGARGSFANVAAPEIQDFIDGSESPPQAPRGGDPTCTAVTPIAGSSMICQPGSWSNNPTFTYTFLSSPAGLVLQSGASPDYQFSTANIGSAVFMRVQAGNAGGTGIDKTTTTAPIMPAVTAHSEPPKTPGRASLASTSITVQSNGTALIKLDCKGSEGCGGKLTLSAKTTSKAKSKKQRSRTVTIGTSKFSIAAGRTTTVKIKLNPAGRGLFNADHGRLTARLAILQLAPAPEHTQTTNVHLTLQKSHGKAKK
jgi:Trypsin